MPELPEVETVRRGLAPVMQGARIVEVRARRPDLRFPLPKQFERRLRGTVVTSLDRRGKYLLAALSSGEVLLIHLGMSGSFRVVAQGRDARTPGRFHHPRSGLRAHDHVLMHFSSGATVVFNDPRRFGFMLLCDSTALSAHPHLRRLGPEPLARTFSAASLARACAGRRTSIKAALSDQRIVAGLGNIYVCEALHRAGISPQRPAGALATAAGAPTALAARLVRAIRAVIRDAIAVGGSSLRDHRRTDGSLGDFQHRFRVYDREGERCPRAGCGGTVRRIVQAGRSSFYCPRCQT
jgi:formamidopyrimidine-DNA glycosylase